MLKRGFTLIEVLVTLVILMFGLLGIAGLMAKGQRASFEAFQRQQESAANLYHNIAHKPQNAGELGLMMPALGFLTEADAGAVREWMRAVAAVPVAPYAPPPARR